MNTIVTNNIIEYYITKDGRVIAVGRNGVAIKSTNSRIFRSDEGSAA